MIEDSGVVGPSADCRRMYGWRRQARFEGELVGVLWYRGSLLDDCSAAPSGWGSLVEDSQRMEVGDVWSG